MTDYEHERFHAARRLPHPNSTEARRRRAEASLRDIVESRDMKTAPASKLVTPPSVDLPNVLLRQTRHNVRLHALTERAQRIAELLCSGETASSKDGDEESQATGTLPRFNQLLAEQDRDLIWLSRIIANLENIVGIQQDGEFDADEEA